MNPDKDVINALAREDFYVFCLIMLSTLYPDAGFKVNWHHRALAYRLSKCSTAYEFSRVIFNLPTQHGKSLIVSVLFIVWILGRNPETKILWVSFSDALVAMFGELRLRIMRSARFREIFPTCVLVKQTQSEIATTAGGRVYATTMQGQITGQPANMLIIDDPHKIDTNLTADELKKAARIYDETLASRLSEPSKSVVICVMQRVSTNDLTAHLLTRVNEPWDQLSLPLVAEEDADIQIGPDEFHHRKKSDILHPEWRGEKDIKALQQNPRAFAAQQQQNPMPDGGVILKPKYLGTYNDTLYRHHFEHVFIGVDGASSLQENASFSAMVAVGVRNNKFYVLDAWRGHVELPELIKQTERFIDAIGPTHVFIENASSGIALAQTLRPRYDDQGIYSLDPIGSKEARLNHVLAPFVNDRVLFPSESAQSQPMVALRGELLTAPHGKTDDLMDALTTVLISVIGYGGHHYAPINDTGKPVSLSFWAPAINS